MILLRVLIIQVDLTDFTNYSWLHRIFTALTLLSRRSSLFQLPSSRGRIQSGSFVFKGFIVYFVELEQLRLYEENLDFYHRGFLGERIPIIYFWFSWRVFNFRDPWFLGSDLAGTVWYNLSRYLFEAKTSTLEVLMRRLFGQLQQLSARQLFLFHMFWK